MRQRLKLGFLASGNGSSMRAIVAAIEAGELDAEPRILVVNRREAPVLGFAAEHRIAAQVIPTLADPDKADARLEAALKAACVDVVVLSGYLRKLGPRTLAAHPNRILNIHPALLPKYGGLGMYGRRVHEAVAAAGERVSGATVHVVDGEYDQGPVIASVEAPLAEGDGPAEIERKVTALEPALYVETLRRICEGTLALPTGGASRISDNLP
jgi:phosphoribosylglycinamide formyltransferase-1